MNNYDYCAAWITRRGGKRIRVLDYGCGAGQVVRLLRAQGFVEVYGCDAFYGGGSPPEQALAAELEKGIIRRMEGDTIPFGPNRFDLVVSNQVFEHVEDLGVVLGEIHRVLAPGGVLLSLFPDRSVWREGHCGIPFLHWLPKKARWRIPLVALLRGVGLGYNKGQAGVWEWSQRVCDWLDRWTYYRDEKRILAQFGGYFAVTTHTEIEYFNERVGSRGPLYWLPNWLKRLVVRKWAGMVLESTRGLNSSVSSEDKLVAP